MDLNRDAIRLLPIELQIEIEENVRRQLLTQTELAIAQRAIIEVPRPPRGQSFACGRPCGRAWRGAVGHRDARRSPGGQVGKSDSYRRRSRPACESN
jgi:hypothetical protein